MKLKNMDLKFNQRSGAAFLLTVCLSVFTLILAGCPENEDGSVNGVASPQATTTDPSDSGQGQMPTIDEMTELLSLDEAQIPQMVAALSELESAREARREMRRSERGSQRGAGHGHGAQAGRQGGRPGSGRPNGDRPCGSDHGSGDGAKIANPTHTFVLSCCEFLSLEQRGVLVSTMAERREAAHAARAENSDQGRRQGGRSGGEHGQQGGRGRGGHGEMGGDHDRLIESLELTEAQQAALEAAHNEIREQKKALREQARADGMTDALREQMKALGEQMKTKLSEILTEEQLAQLEALREERRNERRTENLTRKLENVGRGSERRIEHLTTILDLTPDQISQVTAIQAEAQEAMKALVQGQIDGTLTREEARAQRETIMETTIAQIRETLTEEQAELFDLLQGFFKSPREHKRRGCN